VERGKKESKDYYVLFRDTEVPELTNSDYEKRCAQEDLLPADKATYVWGHIDVLPDYLARAVQTRLDKQLEEEFKEKVGLSNASVPCQFGYELAVYYPLASILKKLSKVSPNLAFLFNVQRLPLQRFWYFPESDDESWQIRQILESQKEQEGSGIFWHLHRIKTPQTHRSFAQVLSLDTIVDGLKRVDYLKMDTTRRAAAVWLIETLLANEKLTRQGFTRDVPFTMPPILSNPPSDTRVAFELAIADEKYLPTLSNRQLEILERGVTIANNIMTSFRPAHKKIANKYEAMRLNNAAMRVSEESRLADEEAKKIEEKKKRIEEDQKRINEEAKRLSEKIYSPYPHLMRAASGQSIDTSKSPDNPLLEAIKEQNEILKERLPLPTTTETKPANDAKATEQPTDVQAVPSENINENSTAPTTEPEELPVVPESVDEQEDVLDLLEKEEGRWVSQDDFLNPDINANRTNFTLKTFRTWRETRYIVWSKKKTAIGMDNGGNFFTRKGKDPRNYRYRYFLLKEYDKQPPPGEK